VLLRDGRLNAVPDRLRLKSLTNREVTNRRQWRSDSQGEQRPD
jgi:hypothetical protein